MGLSVAPQPGRVQGQLPGADQRSIDRDREVDAGVPHVGVVEEVVDAGLEGVRIEQPAAEGNLYTKLVLLIALSVQRSKAGVVRLRVLDDRPCRRKQRWRLVEAPVETAEDPVESRHPHGNTQARVSLILREYSLEVGLAQTGDQRQPRGCFPVVRNVLLDHAACGSIGDAEGSRTTAVVEDGAEKVAVMLAEGEEAGLQRIAFDLRGDRRLRAAIVRGSVHGGCNRRVGGIWLVIRNVRVEERGDGEHHGRVESVDPGEREHAVALVLAVAQTA